MLNSVKDSRQKSNILQNFEGGEKRWVFGGMQKGRCQKLKTIYERTVVPLSIICWDIVLIELNKNINIVIIHY
jgi:hypothetical protein